MKTFNIGIQYGFYLKRMYGEDGPFDVDVETFTIGASDADGHTWVLEGSWTEDEEAAKRLLAALDNNNPETRPDLWFQGEPIYGSNAWDDEAEYNLACEEADAFGEPRPR